MVRLVTRAREGRGWKPAGACQRSCLCWYHSVISCSTLARRGGRAGKDSCWMAAAAAAAAAVSTTAAVVVVAVAAAAAERGECRGDVVGDLEATGGRGHVWVIVSATHHGAHDPPWRRRKVTVTTSWRIQQPATAARGQRNPSRLRTAIHIRASGHSGGGRQGGRPGRQTGSRAGTAPREE